MGVRWVINFGTLDRSCSVTISDSTYNGTPIQLTPANNAFTLSRKIPDFYEPIVQESGQINIIDTDDSNQHLDEIHPLNALARPVAVYYDGQLYWRGFLSPEALTIDYGPAPRVLSFPVVGALSVLSSINMSGNETSPKSIAYYLMFCLQQTGYTWSNIYMPPQLDTIEDDDSPQTYYGVPELRLCVSIYNFFSPNNSINIDANYSELVGDNLEECLKSICRFFGWTIIPDGNDIYLSSPNVNLKNPVVISWSNLLKLATNPMDYTFNPYEGSTPRPTINLSTLNYSGLNHRRTIKNGAKRVIISHNNKDNKNQYPVVKYNGKIDVHAQFLGAIGDMLQYNLLGSVNFLDPTNETKIFLYSYRWNSNTQAFDLITWAPYTYQANNSTPRSDIVETYSELLPWPSEPTDSNNKTKCLRLCRAYYPGQDSNKHLLPSNKILARLHSLTTSFYPSNGALCLSGIVTSNYNVAAGTFAYVDHEGLVNYQNFSGTLFMAIQIGDKYFDGTTWSSTYTTLSVVVENGIIKNTNTNSQYNNAEGFIMPLDQDLFGDTKIAIWPWQGSTNFDTLFIRELKIEYCSDTIGNEISDPNIISVSTGVNFIDDKNITLSLTSAKNTVISPSLVYWNDKPVGKSKIFMPYYPSGPIFAIPEEYLINVIKDVYKKPSNWLTLETVFDSSIKMWSLILNNNTYHPDNKKYIIVGMEIDFADNTTKLMIATYK